MADEHVGAAHHRFHRVGDTPHRFTGRDVGPNHVAADRKVHPHHRGVRATGLNALLDPADGGFVHDVGSAVEPIHGRQNHDMLITLYGCTIIQKVVDGLGCCAGNGLSRSHDSSLSGRFDNEDVYKSERIRLSFIDQAESTIDPYHSTTIEYNLPPTPGKHRESLHPAAPGFDNRPAA